MDFNNYKNIIREKLDDYRYNHSLCVADEALRLAKLYGVDENDAYLAGLLHDITKNYNEDQHLRIFTRFGIILSDVEKTSTKLWHAISGAAYVKNVLNINNDAVISAIRYHTTAKSSMTHLEKLVYLADLTSADRSYEDVEIMRNLVNTNIDDALAYALSFTIKDLVDKGVSIHPDTFEAYNQIMLTIKLRGAN